MFGLCISHYSAGAEGSEAFNEEVSDRRQRTHCKSPMQFWPKWQNIALWLSKARNGPRPRKWGFGTDWNGIWSFSILFLTFVCVLWVMFASDYRRASFWWFLKLANAVNNVKECQISDYAPLSPHKAASDVRLSTRSTQSQISWLGDVACAFWTTVSLSRQHAVSPGSQKVMIVQFFLVSIFVLEISC